MTDNRRAGGEWALWRVLSLTLSGSLRAELESVTKRQLVGVGLSNGLSHLQRRRVADLMEHGISDDSGITMAVPPDRDVPTTGWLSAAGSRLGGPRLTALEMTGSQCQ